MKSQIFHIAETTSTNDVLKKMLLKNALEEGFTVVADFQTAGRGQAAKKWESERGKNLLFSTVFYPSDVPIQQQFLFSKAMALGLRSALTELLNEEVRIKWPNDIYWHDKKLCGILIETSVSGGFMTQVIVGVGINVNQTQFVSDAPNPVSMCQIAGKEFDRNTVLEKVVVAMLFENSNRDANLQRRYFDALY
ncbi:MAG TPA: biotin--[acetyl-CoA-carboxylase] ligase, partial [Paludibacteraceae bacterium]|nr:biotin--[acetyl-CoA-carboxylase] ligase [Paludibacteraceae bacterium]